MNKRKIKAFWQFVPNNTTMEEMADGIDVNFVYMNKDYKVNTRIEQARTKSFETCYRIWDERASNA